MSPQSNAYAPTVDYNPGANPDIISIRLGQNKFKESTTPLPDVIRRHYRIRWTPAHKVAHQGLRVWLRSTKQLFPRPLRVSPVYEFAVARTADELDNRPALLQNLVRQPRLA
jgi:hypothetical protein